MPFESCRGEILAQLDRILVSKDFYQAPSLSKLLRFLVMQTLDGKTAGLKEVSIGVEVFSHLPNDGTVKTPVVRVSACRVRKRLAAYYETLGREDPWIITLSGEGYAPQILARATPLPGERALDPLPRVRDFGKSRWTTFATVGAAAFLLLMMSLVAWAYSNRKPVVIAFSQLTNTAHMKDGPLLTDGSRVYFEDRIGGVAVPVSTLVGGGMAQRLELPSIESPMLLDYQNEGHRFLVLDEAPSANGAFWEWTPGTPPRRLTARDLTRWIPDPRLVQAAGGKLVLRKLNRAAPAMAFPSSGVAEFPRWLPSRELFRFTVSDPPGEKYSLWEIRGLNGTPEPLHDFPKNARFGTWSPDGRVFVFQADRNNAEGGDDIWAVKEEGLGFLRKSAKPIRLTNGPLDFEYPVPSPDGKAIFTIGTVQRMEIVRYDALSGEYQPVLGGLGGLEPDFSRDHRWIAYSSYPARTLWKVKADGTQATELTFPPMSATQPHWSPDGARIAFMGQYPGHPWRVYVIPVSGGIPDAVTDYPVEQGVPTWSPDGTRLAFGERRLARPDQDMELHVVDLLSKRVSSVPNSRGTWTARWSPDGRFIAATSVDFHRLLLFDCRANTWRQLASFRTIDDPSWAADSRYIYFYAQGRLNAPDVALPTPAIYRMSIQGSAPEIMVDLKKFEPREFPWHGVAPDGAPLAARLRTMQEVYKLTIQW